MARMSFGSIPEGPELYHQVLGPAMFEHFAQEVTTRIPVRGANQILELACGTGILTKALPASSQVLATEIDDGMLSEARKHTARPFWALADMNVLPLTDRCFDLAICQFGLMFLKSPLDTLNEVRRVLRPGGEFMACTWCSLEDNNAILAVHDTIRDLLPDHEVPFLNRPFTMSDPEALRKLFVSAGFSNVSVSKLKSPKKSVDPNEFSRAAFYGNPLAAALLERGVTNVDELQAAVRQRLQEDFGDPATFSMSALLAIGKA